MDVGSIAQWLGAAVTVLAATFGFWKWIDHKLDQVYQSRDTARQDIEKVLVQNRSEAFVQSQKAETAAMKASADVARLEVKMANDYLSKSDFHTALDMHFNQLFIRIASLEQLVGQLVAMKLSKP
jgi:hypothetical protein